MRRAFCGEVPGNVLGGVLARRCLCKLCGREQMGEGIGGAINEALCIGYAHEPRSRGVCSPVHAAPRESPDAWWLPSLG